MLKSRKVYGFRKKSNFEFLIIVWIILLVSKTTQPNLREKLYLNEIVVVFSLNKRLYLFSLNFFRPILFLLMFYG